MDDKSAEGTPKPIGPILPLRPAVPPSELGAEPPESAVSLPAAVRHPAQPPERAKEEHEERFDPKREEMRAALEKAAQRNPEDYDMVKNFNELLDEQKAENRRVANIKGPKIMAIDMATEEVSRDDARKFLEVLYDKMPPEEIDKILRDAEVEAAFDANKDKAASEEGMLEGKSKEEVDAIGQDLARDERVQTLAAKGERIMQNPDATDEEKQVWLKNVADIFGTASGKTLMKLFKYTTIGGGIFALIIIVLLAIHTPKGNS